VRVAVLKKLLPVLVLILTGVIALISIFVLNRPTKPTPQAESATPAVEEKDVVAEIHMRGNTYTPDTVTIKQGQAIRFINDDTRPYWPASNIHPTHELYSEFDPGKAVPPGDTWTFRFDQVGSWRMHDHLYPFIKGMITVE
jgi:plastocyanin